MNQPVQMNTPASGNTSAQIHDKEAEFHDQWAQSIPLEQITVREAFEAPTAFENRFILRKMGDISGLKLLDIGAGLGESSVYFALRGAQVTATDLSPAMVQCAVNLGKHHGVNIEGVVSPGESLGVPESAFDLVYVANTIHHVTDKPALFRQIHRALRPGGRFFSFDPIAYNPVINIYRKMATQVRTEDESPLTFADVALARQFFQDVGHREFWVASLALFLKYYLVDRVHPNADRYWKRIFKETNKSLWWWQPLRGADAILTRLPLVRRLSWNMVMWGRKA
jgi:SAM-dependent methyltransferase